MMHIRVICIVKNIMVILIKTNHSLMVAKIMRTDGGSGMKHEIKIEKLTIDLKNTYEFTRTMNLLAAILYELPKERQDFFMKELAYIWGSEVKE